jgi:hypothetical protein
MKPEYHTLMPRKQVVKMNEDYAKFLVVGSVKEDHEIIRDKSQSFAYAIKDRFESMKSDGVDFTKLSKN